MKDKLAEFQEQARSWISKARERQIRLNNNGKVNISLEQAADAPELWDDDSPFNPSLVHYLRREVGSTHLQSKFRMTHTN